MSAILESALGAERRAECIRQDAALVQAMYPALESAEQQCEHRYLTSYGKGWVCANRACGIGILSLSVPLPMPLVEEALRAIAPKVMTALEAANEAPRLRAYLVTIGHRLSFEVMATSSFAAWDEAVRQASGDERVEVRKVVRHG